MSFHADHTVLPISCPARIVKEPNDQLEDKTTTAGSRSPMQLSGDMVAILPAAGKGTRMALLTGGRPKELLPVGGREVIQWVLDEAKEAGARRIVVVSSTEKPELNAYLTGRAEVVFQHAPAGHADAVTTPNVDGAALVLNPDTIFFPDSPSRSLVEAVAHGADMAIAIQEVDEARKSQYGIVELHSGAGRIAGIVEKPQPGETASRWAIAGRYAFSRRAYNRLREHVRAAPRGTVELSLPQFLVRLIEEGHSGVAISLASNQTRFDCGLPEGYDQACRAVA